ncbi:DNA-directed RNA polymerase 7 kDa subunit, partial [Monkeypox virus]
VLVSVKNECCR